jgi:hypothetical protein
MEQRRDVKVTLSKYCKCLPRREARRCRQNLLGYTFEQLNAPGTVAPAWPSLQSI